LINIGESIHEMSFVVHARGFTLTPTKGGGSQPQHIVRLWSPFTLVEKCQVKALQQAEHWAVFKLTVFRQQGTDLSFYLASSGPDADRQRASWLAAVVDALANVTASLIPDHELRVQPVLGKARTYRRIIAGYLLYCECADKATVFYCELHAQMAGVAELVFYSDDYCEEELFNIVFQDTAAVSTRKGAYCTVFGLDMHRFCARNREEKDLWLRAVSNIKVKLMFGAPDPTAGELAIFRAAVHERLEALPLPRRELPGPSPDECGAAAVFGSLPLLDEEPRRPPLGPSGDPEDPPEPAEEDAPAPRERGLQVPPWVPGSEEWPSAGGPGAELRSARHEVFQALLKKADHPATKEVGIGGAACQELLPNPPALRTKVALPVDARESTWHPGSQRDSQFPSEGSAFAPGGTPLALGDRARGAWRPSERRRRATSEPELERARTESHLDLARAEAAEAAEATEAAKAAAAEASAAEASVAAAVAAEAAAPTPAAAAVRRAAPGAEREAKESLAGPADGRAADGGAELLSVWTSERQHAI